MCNVRWIDSCKFRPGLRGNEFVVDEQAERLCPRAVVGRGNVHRQSHDDAHSVLTAIAICKRERNTIDDKVEFMRQWKVTIWVRSMLSPACKRHLPLCHGRIHAEETVAETSLTSDCSMVHAASFDKQVDKRLLLPRSPAQAPQPLLKPRRVSTTACDLRAPLQDARSAIEHSGPVVRSVQVGNWHSVAAVCSSRNGA